MIDEDIVLFKLKQCIPIFTVLADENRQKIVMMLSRDPEGLNVLNITESLPLSRPAVSHHLKLLKNAGLISVNRKGTENYYYLTLKTSLANLKELIKDIEMFCNIKSL